MLISLWSRSFSVVDAVIVPVSPRYECGIGTANGTVVATLTNSAEGFQRFQEPIDDWVDAQHDNGWPVPSPLWGACFKDDAQTAAAVPCWLLLSITIVVGLLPWTTFKLRFSLRAILFITALAAATLALII